MKIHNIASMWKRTLADDFPLRLPANARLVLLILLDSMTEQNCSVGLWLAEATLPTYVLTYLPAYLHINTCRQAGTQAHTHANPTHVPTYLHAGIHT